MEYQDFVLQLDRAPSGPGFLARVIRSPAGEAEVTFLNPVLSMEIERLWDDEGTRPYISARGSRDLHPGAKPPSQVMSSEPSLEELGDRLFRALFRGQVRDCWTRSLAGIEESSGKGLRLKLQLNLSDPLVAPLTELPWELLYSEENGGFLALQRRTPVLRHMRLPLPVGQASVVKSLRILIVSSQPDSMPELALENEGEKIATALSRIPGIEAVPLHDPSVEELREALLEKDFHVLHFMGHGGFDSGSGQGVLFFTAADKTALPVSGALLASQLAGMPSIRLIFLNACETARSNARAPFAGVATALLKAGLPAVVAMQSPVRDDSALEFSRTVYRRLALGDPIDAAVTEGRLAIVRGLGKLLEWGTPVLFSRAEDGHLFILDSMAVPSEAPVPVHVGSEAVITADKPRRFRLVHLLVALLSLGLGLGMGTFQWRSVQEPRQELDRTQEEGAQRAKAVNPVPAPTPIDEPKKPEPETKASPRESRSEPPENPKVIAESPKVTVPFSSAPKQLSYELSEGSPVTIAGLEAEAGANFYERDGHAFARFWISPAGQGMLQRPPVVGPGLIEFEAQNGVYRMQVLGLDLAERTARIKVSFTPAGEG